MSEPAVLAQGLVKTFGDFLALDGLDLTVTTGEVHGFLGPNGAGKSTAIRILLGLYRPTAGQVRVLGLDPEMDPGAVCRRASYVPGEVALWPSFTGQEVLDALAGLRGAYDADAERRLVDAFALDPSRRVRTYSKGNRQKVMLVAAFAARTDLLVLDEPTSGLDPLMEEVFASCVREAAAAGRTVLLSSHILSEVERLCGRVTIVKDGRLVETGRVDEMRHLASSTVSAVVPSGAGHRLSISGVEAAWAGDRVSVRVAGHEVNDVLRALMDVGATSITCEPATLEELFLRHYEVAAR
ncbi:ABC transporter ATP-binding protein [Nocardioides sp. zg-1228]|uniref:ABC transporter ATP-binding protein n=1 Tax=Nocardioides sp. zg-1228 TaxID=2763008 RepID=UPI001642873E|nr:ABC transporter ATP-binding protein [Nocardioides sp. zg-1228]MBC2932086.1 ABC transporter ATP-binding protein [Nocardioides sp. zg-1228]QSF57634.1 ABC transporter ATP-binding protein [Nocardioides sp. zg-1228]